MLRASAGDEIVVFDGSGAEFAATVIDAGKAGVRVRVAGGGKVDREMPLACLLAQAISSGERMDYTLQKAVELGVAGVQPLYSERSVVRLDAERAQKRVAHWRQVMIAACEQCGRNLVPTLAEPLELTDWLAGLSVAPHGELRILLAPAGAVRLADLPRPDNVVLLAGCEGGYTQTEAELAHGRGFVALRLGPRVLRTETAALAALAAINTVWGDF